MTDIKTELPYLNLLPDCETLIKNEFNSDDEFEFKFNPDSEQFETLDDDNDEKIKHVDFRKNKRKTLTPQKTMLQSDGDLEAVFAGTMMHDDNIFTQICMDGGIMLSDGEEDLLLDVEEEDIFKGIQEEADGEKLADEIIDNVKEEWRAHWGVKCNMCEKVFQNKKDFDAHYTESYGLVPIYSCSFCNKTAEKYSTFRSHCYRHITEGRYKCNECPKGFSLQSMLRVHTIAKHGKAKPYSCEMCGKSFVTKSGLKIHAKKHKSNTKEDYPCGICGKILHTRGGLTSHMNVHRLGRRFMCDICGKTFTQKVNMQQHARQHTGDKPYSCDKCGKTFAEKSHLARHYSFHSEQRPFKCEVCQKMYKTERCLKVHSMVHAAERPFVCKICSKGFLSSTKLKQHYNIHTGERPYACKYCERRFTNYPNWLKHTRRRHKVDHRTGEELVPKETKKPVKFETVILKTETLPANEVTNTTITTTTTAVEGTTSIPPAADQFLSSVSTNTDFLLGKTDDAILDDSQLNFPLNDDKFVLQHDLFGSGTNANSGSVGLLIPFLNNQPSTHSSIASNPIFMQQTFPVYLNDFFVTTQMIQQTLPCD